MLDFLEMEETVGKAWHRLIGKTGSWPYHPQHEVRLTDIRNRLAICFRGFGGEAGIQIAPARARSSAHRLGLLQRMALGEEKLAQPERDDASLMLPPAIGLFADQALNYDLYVWLAAYMACMPGDMMPTAQNRLQQDLAALRQARSTTQLCLQLFPGLAPRYRRLCQAMLDARPKRPLHAIEQRVEDQVIALLQHGAGLDSDNWLSLLPQPMPAGYLPLLPVPLWPQRCLRDEISGRTLADEPVRGENRAALAGTRQVARREKSDPHRAERSPFILNRFEKFLAMAEMVAVDRPSDDSDEHDASAADELDDLTLGERKGRPAARFRFDLDLPPETVDERVLNRHLTYPEWDYRKAGYLQDHCAVIAASPSLSAAGIAEPVLDEEARHLIRRVRRQFEILRPGRQIQRAQADGDELDLDALVRSRADMAAGGVGSDRVYLQSRPQRHDLAVTILVDVSLSTDAWVDNRRVLDVEKEALLVLANGIAACGDRCSIMTFTSRRRDWVRMETLKTFDEAFSPAVESRIASIRPGYYTRMGAAIRHASAELNKQPNRKKLLLLLTDGKPNDVDYYEGRFALEDTRRAVAEARRTGLNLFAVTIDREAGSYLPLLFGQQGFARVDRLNRLPVALPAIYRMLAG